MSLLPFDTLPAHRPRRFVPQGIDLGNWGQIEQDKAEALKRYKQALALGGSRPLPELFAAAGGKFEFSRKTMGPLVKLVRDELARLPAEK